MFCASSEFASATKKWIYRRIGFIYSCHYLAKRHSPCIPNGDTGTAEEVASNLLEMPAATTETKVRQIKDDEGSLSG